MKQHLEHAEKLMKELDSSDTRVKRGIDRVAALKRNLNEASRAMVGCLAPRQQPAPAGRLLFFMRWKSPSDEWIGYLISASIAGTARRPERFSRLMRKPQTIGSSETKTMPTTTSSKFSFTTGHVAEDVARAAAEADPEDAAASRCKNANCGYDIEPAPATNGTNVRTIGTNRPSTTALPP